MYLKVFFFIFNQNNFCSTIDISIFCFTLSETLDGEADYSSPDDDEGVWLGNKKSFERKRAFTFKALDTETEKTVVVDVKKTTTKPKKVLTEVPETETTASASKEKNDIAPVEKSVSNIIFFSRKQTL